MYTYILPVPIYSGRPTRDRSMGIIEKIKNIRIEGSISMVVSFTSHVSTYGMFVVSSQFIFACMKGQKVLCRHLQPLAASCLQSV